MVRVPLLRSRHVEWSTLLIVVASVMSTGCQLNRNDPYRQVTANNAGEANSAVRGESRRRGRGRRALPRHAFRNRDLERTILDGVRAHAAQRGWGERLSKVRILDTFPHGYEIAVGARFSERRCAYHRLRVITGYDGAYVVAEELEIRRLSCRAL